MKPVNAIYPLSGDPLHKGHLHIICDTAERFNRLYVAIAHNAAKKCLFSVEERVQLAQKSIRPLGIENVIVEPLPGMIGHYAYERNASVIVRGSREGNDFGYERVMADYNRSYGLSTLIVPAPSELSTLSSSLIRDVVKAGGLVNNYVHPAVKQALEEKLQDVSLIGVTGNMGAGKTTFCKQLELQGISSGLRIQHLDMDQRLHSLFRKDAPAYPRLYEKMRNAFGEQVCEGDGINRKALAQLVWGDAAARTTLSRIMAVPFRIELEKAIEAGKGVLLVDVAYLVEYSALDLVNNNVLLVTCDEEERAKRVMRRDGIDLSEFNRKASSQMTAEHLKGAIMKEQAQQQYGFFHEIDSSKPNYEAVLQLFAEKFPLIKGRQ